MKYRVVVVEIETKEVVRSICTAPTLVSAHRVARGVEINLNWDDYYVDIWEVSDDYVSTDSDDEGACQG